MTGHCLQVDCHGRTQYTSGLSWQDTVYRGTVMADIVYKWTVMAGHSLQVDCHARGWCDAAN